MHETVEGVHGDAWEKEGERETCGLGWESELQVVDQVLMDCDVYECHGEYALEKQQECCAGAHLSIEDMGLGLLFGAGIGEQLDNLGADHLGVWIAGKDEKGCLQWGKAYKDAPQGGEIGNEGKDSIGAYVGVFHDGKGALSVASGTETISEVGKSVFMKGSRDEHSHGDAAEDCKVPRKDERGSVHGTCHTQRGEPTHHGPVFHHGGVVLLRWCCYAPEG